MWHSRSWWPSQAEAGGVEGVSLDRGSCAASSLEPGARGHCTWSPGHTAHLLWRCFALSLACAWTDGGASGAIWDWMGLGLRGGMWLHTGRDPLPVPSPSPTLSPRGSRAPSCLVVPQVGSSFVPLLPFSAGRSHVPDSDGGVRSSRMSHSFLPIF